MARQVPLVHAGRMDVREFPVHLERRATLVDRLRRFVHRSCVLRVQCALEVEPGFRALRDHKETQVSRESQAGLVELLFQDCQVLSEDCSQCY